MTNMEKLLKSVAEEILTEHYELFEIFLRKWLGVAVSEDFDYHGCSIDLMRHLGKLECGFQACMSDSSCSECTRKWLNEEYKEEY